MEKLKMKSKNLINGNINKISELFPNCISEGKIDFEILKQELSKDIIEEGKEKYEFTWVGKKQSIVNANTPIEKTLRPLKEKSVDFDSTKNIYIEGDNLEVLKILQESYLNKIRCIYIDPPYNTGNDFVYTDNFKKKEIDELKESGQIDEYNNRLITNNESNGRFHSDWLSMMYPRLKLARNLLTEDGVIFISIDDNELANLIKICDEIFGENNFVTNFIWQSTAGSNMGTDIVTITENVLVYAKSRKNFISDGLIASENSYIYEDEYLSKRGKYALDKLDRRRVGSHYSDSLNYGITMPDGTIRYPGGSSNKSKDGWNYLWSKAKVEWGIKEGFIEFKQKDEKWNVYNKRYEKMDNEGNYIERTVPYKNLITSNQYNTAQGTSELRALFGFRPFDFPKPSEFIKYLLLTTIRNDKNAIVLDFFSGSSSTAQAVIKINSDDNGNRKFIMVQIPEKYATNSEAYKNGYKTICEIGEKRIRKAGEKIKEETNANIDYGFRVYRVDSSNMKDVYYTPTELQQSQLNMFESNVKEDRTAEDLLTQVILDLGLTLDLSIEEKKILNNNVYFVESNSLVACFDDTIDINIIDEICKCKPLKIVFKESSFKTDSDKINTFERIKKLSSETEINVI